MFYFQFCEAQGGYLTEIDNMAEQAVISEFGGIELAFIGFDSLGRSDPDDYILRHSGRKLDAGFTCWSSDEPNNDDERCGSFDIFNAGGDDPKCGVGVGWNDLWCDRVTKAICERDPE